ncbi:MAG: cation-binding protein [Rhodospirillaceae bacterium]|jgi:hemerythrin-like domain-containing protein|nr:cation-binding protein [Rhodospirillaceae bacterium]|tara:strand:- start:988 stop:1542 length:555 start_codon:yes stop_codon:yes gene_type:complete
MPTRKSTTQTDGEILMEYSLRICNMLHDDHMTTIGLLERIEAALPRVGRKSPPDVNDAELSRLLGDLAATMQGEVTSHFEFEEQNLFTRIEEMGETPMIGILRGEHEIIRPLAADLMQAVAAARSEGFSAESWAAFYDLGLELADRETFHIQKEEMAFLPLLDQIIDEEEDNDLCQAFTAARSG